MTLTFFTVIAFPGAKSKKAWRKFLASNSAPLTPCTRPEDYIDLPHGTRTGPIERRFRGQERLTRLRNLKKEFDPQGRFTREFL